MTEYKKLLKGAKTIDGMFKVHIVKDKYYFEIHKDLMGLRFYDCVPEYRVPVTIKI